MNIFNNKNIIIFGGTGSIGSVIAKKILKYHPKQVRIFARDEAKHQELFETLKFPPNMVSLIGDVRDKDRVRFAMKDVDIAFNVAALKAVQYCEYNPTEAIYTNIYGTQNIINSAMEENIEKMVMVSTDKAVEPVGVLGATKLLMERLTTVANYYRGKNKTIFTSIRFGNVLGSRNSVMQIVKRQIITNRTVTVTNPKMTRFIISIPDAVKLTFNALSLAKGGEVFVLKMPAVYVGDLVDVYCQKICVENHIKRADVKIKLIKSRPGEKMYERLLSDYDIQNCYENADFFVIPSNIDSSIISADVEKYGGFTRLVDVSSFDSNAVTKIGKSEIKRILNRTDH